MSTPSTQAAKFAEEFVYAWTIDIDQDKCEKMLGGLPVEGKCIKFNKDGEEREFTKLEYIHFLRHNHWNTVKKIDLHSLKLLPNENTPSAELLVKATHIKENRQVTAMVPIQVVFCLDMSNDTPSITSLDYKYSPYNFEQTLLS